MQLLCPKCATSYQLDPATIGTTGRSVRCARCKNVWFAQASELQPAPFDVAREEAAFREEFGARAAPSATPAGSARPASVADLPAEGTGAEPPAESAAPPALPATGNASPPGMTTPAGTDDGPPAPAGPTPESSDPAAPALSEIKTPAVEAPPLADQAANAAASDPATIASEPEDIESVAARRMPASAAAPRRRIMTLKSRLPAGILVLVAVCATIIGWRKDIVRHMPQMASLYAAIGLPVNVRGLVFTDIRIANDTQDGVPVLTVEGAIANVVPTAVEVPRLRFALRNAAGVEVYSWTAMPAQTVLGPGETLPLRTRLASPPGDVHDVQVRFFNRRDAAAGPR